MKGTLLALSLVVFVMTGCKQETMAKRSPRQPEDPLIIAAIGDSITWGALAFGAKAASGGYPAILENKLRSAGHHVVVFNKGIPGEKAYQAHERFARAIADADVVLLMIGTNDIIRPEGCPEPNHCRTAEHIAAMLEIARAAGVPVFISTVPPAQPRCDRSWANAPIDVLNGQIADVARQRKVSLIDNHQAIIATDGTLFSDCLHFTDEGYALIAEQWYQALRVQHIFAQNGH